MADPAGSAAPPAPAAATVECAECGATLQLGEYLTAVCPYCACPTVVERPATADRPSPMFVVPFTVPRARAQAAVRAWLARRRLLHRSFARARVEDIRGIYLPAGLYSAVVAAAYSAEIGEHYTVVETYTTTVNGKTVTRTRTRTKTEWRPLSGRHAAYATDVLVTASRGLPNHELARIEPFDLRALRRYDPALVSGWLVEEASLDLAQCTELARDEATEQERAQLAGFLPGDSHRNVRAQISVRDETIDPMLVPVWVLAVRPHADRAPLRVAINGQTGEVVGPEKLSPVKILLLALAAMALVLVVALIAGALR